MVTLRRYHNKNAHSSWRRLKEPVAGGAPCSVDTGQWPGALSGLKVPFAVALHFLGDLTSFLSLHALAVPATNCP